MNKFGIGLSIAVILIIILGVILFHDTLTVGVLIPCIITIVIEIIDIVVEVIRRHGK